MPLHFFVWEESQNVCGREGFSSAALSHPNTLRYRFFLPSSPRIFFSFFLGNSCERLVNRQREGLILSRSQVDKEGRQWATDYGNVVFARLSGFRFDEPPDTEQEAAEWAARRQTQSSRTRRFLRLLNSFGDAVLYKWRWDSITVGGGFEEEEEEEKTFKRANPFHC